MAPVFEFDEEVLDLVAFPVGRLAVRECLPAIFLRRDTGLNLLILNDFSDLCAVMATVRD
ncbi:MAG: hypothetical protein CR993_01915 [Rhodobacterales bacterium]|nr:MAG: hypothetical protein CR993_01915 [Rhodobacterales bacterium]